MSALAGWYPGDGVVFAGLEVLGVISILVLAAWAVEQLGHARHRAAFRASLWLTALVGVILAPALVLAGRQLPWHVAVFSRTGSSPTADGSGEVPFLET